MYLSYN